MVRVDGLRLGDSPFAVIELDSELRVVAWDDRAELAFGATRGEAEGQAIDGLIPSEGGAAGWRELLEGVDGAYVRRLTRAGDGRVFEWRRQQLLDAEGAVRGAVVFGCDVTARAAAEHQLGLQEQTLRAICSHINIVVWAIDRAGTMVLRDGNPTVMAPLDLLGKNMFEVYAHHPDGLAQLRKALAGEAQSTSTFERGRHWQSWMVPVEDAATGVALIAISLEVSEIKQNEAELRDKLAVIERQQQALHAMSTPIIEVWDGVLCLPILGLVDSVRTGEIMEGLLQAVTRVRARFAILDMTGVDVVDTSTAAHLIGLIRAIRLLGAEGIITGIHPNIAQTMVGLEVDLRNIVVHANLREALKYCIGRARPRAG